ncbi:MAG: NhaP-type Na+/H+ or K+/H+ antiporter [Oleiphilaceae bacterium]|jgi:NhaP-type Na+/H+ or K+/H+ antiporter
MDFQLTFFGELVFYSIFIVGGLSYYLGKRKTSNPKVATLLGVILCLTPPLNLVYLFVLILKNDEVPDAENES